MENKTTNQINQAAWNAYQEDKLIKASLIEHLLTVDLLAHIW